MRRLILSPPSRSSPSWSSGWPRPARRRTPAADAPAFDLAQAKRELAGAPPPLAALHEQSTALLTGGTEAFDERLDDLGAPPS